MNPGGSTIIPVNNKDDARCLACGYALRGLSENRCPECGKEFDPQNALTMSTPFTRQRLRLAYWLPSVLLLTTFVTLAAGLMILTALSGSSRRILFGSRTGLACWMAVLFCLSWWLRTRARSAILWPIQLPKRRSKWWGRLFIGGIVVLIFFGSGGINAWSCPHGRSFRLGPLVITHSTTGGPCNNTEAMLETWRVSENWYLSLAD